MEQKCNNQGKLLYVETLGCQMNVSDSEKIVALLKDAGYRPTPDSSRADLIILNTCSVRAKAEQKVYNHLNEYKGLKGRKRRLLLGVGGCVAQQEGERLLANVPHLDIVFGTHNLHLLPELVRAAERGEGWRKPPSSTTTRASTSFPPIPGMVECPASSPSCRGATTSARTASSPMSGDGRSAGAPRK